MIRARHLARRVLAVIGVSVLIGGPALAFDATAARKTCDRDVERLCGGSSVPDERRILACLLPDRTRLSPACRQAAEPLTLAATEPGHAVQR